MLTLKAKIRKEIGRQVRKIREEGFIPAVLYGPKIKNIAIEINQQDFKKTFKETGESSLISLDIEGKKFPVLIHDFRKDPVSGKIIHIDFYQPILTEEVEVTIPIVFDGESPAVKDLGGTLIKEISEVAVKALPENLPHKIKVDISNLRTFDDEILIKDLIVPQGVKIERNSGEVVAVVTRPEKIEEELAKPVEEKVEEVKKVEKKKEGNTEEAEEVKKENKQ